MLFPHIQPGSVQSPDKVKKNWMPFRQFGVTNLLTGFPSPSPGRRSDERRSDERIREELCEMLTRDHSVDATDIEIEVKDGEVILTGVVPERSMKYVAEDLAARSFGVKDVHNQLRLKSDFAKAP